MILRTLPLCRIGANPFWKSLQTALPVKMLALTNKSWLIQPSVFELTRLNGLINYQFQTIAIMRRLFEENSAEEQMERAILNVNTHRRKKTKLKKSQRKQKRKKMRRLSDRKRKKLNL